MKRNAKVHCKAYLEEVCDGVFIRMYKPDGSVYEDNFVTDHMARAFAYKWDHERHKEEKIKDLSDFYGDSVEKIYRKRIECCFDGIVVGYSSAAISGRIGTAWETSCYGYKKYYDYGYVFKDAPRQPICIVQLEDGSRRKVLRDDLEEVN